jgi:hypothetical protein
MAKKKHADKEKQKSIEALREKQYGYLESEVVECEDRHLFKFAQAELYSEGDPHRILTEADKSRLILKIIEKLLIKNMANMGKEFDSFKRRDDNQTFIEFMK